MYSASAFAANTLCRSALAAAYPLFTVQMFDRVRFTTITFKHLSDSLSFQLGVNWACTLIGLISLVFVPCPFLFYRYGARIRTRSHFPPCLVCILLYELY